MNTTRKAQIETAENVIKKYGYTCPCVVIEWRLSERAKRTWFGFRFEAGRSVGDVIKERDGSVGVVRQVITNNN